MPKFCTNCGSALVEGNKFCSECGFKIEDETVASELAKNMTCEVEPYTVENIYTNPSTPKKSKRKKWILWTAIASTVVIVASIVLFVCISLNFKIRFIKYDNRPGIEIGEQYIKVRYVQTSLSTDKGDYSNSATWLDISDVAEELDIPAAIISKIHRCNYDQWHIEETEDVRVRWYRDYEYTVGDVYEVIFELKDKRVD